MARGLFRPWLTALVLAMLVSEPGSAIAGFSDTFFSDLGEKAGAIVERCVEHKECDQLQSLNIGPQYYKLFVWDREIGGDFLAEPAGKALLVDASALDQLLHDFYLWPKEIPRIGRVDLKSMPGLAVERKGLTIHVTPDEEYTPELDLGGYRVIKPDEFDLPGKAVYAQFAGSIDTASYGAPGRQDEPRFRIGADFGAQWGLWQMHSRGVLGNYEGSTDLDYLYLDRPLLSRAMRLRFGYMPAIVDCNLCVSGDFAGVSLSGDSLGGLLYPARNTTFVDVDIPGDVDQIEIVVNGRTLRRENAFPGTHSVAVTGLLDGPNAIDIFGIDSASGSRRILRSLSRTASLDAPEQGRPERTLQLGWTTADTNSLFRKELDVDTAFAQFHQITGLGDGRQWDIAALVTSRGGLVQSSLSRPLGTGRAEATATGSFSEGKAGGGLGFQISQRFQALNVAASGDICFDCFDGRSMKMREGLTGRVSGSLSTRWHGTSLSGTLSYEFLDRDLLNWRISARRNAFGGYLELYAGNVWNLNSWNDGKFPDNGMEVGLRFSRTFGGERMRSVQSELRYEEGRAFANTTYTDRPRDSEGFFGQAEAETGYNHGADDRNLSLSAQLGYEDHRARAAVNVAKHGEDTEVQADAATGFVWVDGEFVVDRSVTRGGIFADGLLPGSPVFVGSAKVQTADALGQIKLPVPRATRPVRFGLDEGFDEEGATASRAASLLPLPGAYYGIGQKYRKVERSYRILVGRENTPIAAGTLLRGEDGEILGAAGDDGIVSVSGRPGKIVFEQPELICRTEFTGKEPGDDLPALKSVCKVPEKSTPGT